MDSINFFDIKSNIIDHMKRQDSFKDLNYEASAINALIDALAYAAYHINVYANFALNESFLDTAQVRSSVVSKAQNIGYVPSQYLSSKASVMLTYTGTQALDGYTIPIGTTFQAVKDGTTYYFRTYETALVNQTSTGRYWTQVYLREGTMMTERWTQDADRTTRFVLPANNVDLSTLTVKVYESVSDNAGRYFQETKNIIQFATELPALYTVIENTDGNVELIFGDGVLAKSIDPGNIVEVNYLACSGEDANDIAVFDLLTIPGASYDISQWLVSTAEVSNSGADRESIESIRANAPKFFQRQGRNVVADDYYSDIMSRYSSLIDSMSVWGGEDNDPPDYGSVYISIKPKGALSLSTLQKEDIMEAIEESSVVGITPKIVDPTVIYVNMTMNVEYNRLGLRTDLEALHDEIISTTLAFFNNNVSSFNVDFRYSKFLSNIFAIDEVILDITLDNSLYMYFEPNVTVRTTYELDFKNAIKPGSVLIGPYAVLGVNSTMLYMADTDGDGILREYNDDEATEVGIIDYENGVVTIENYTFSTTSGEQIPITMKPASNNMSVTQDYIFSIDSINVEMIANDEKNGNGTSYESMTS